MQVSINGETKDIPSQTVIQLLEALGIDPRKVAIELNTVILPKAEYEITAVKDGDRMEIVHFVGGG